MVLRCSAIFACSGALDGLLEVFDALFILTLLTRQNASFFRATAWLRVCFKTPQRSHVALHQDLHLVRLLIIHPCAEAQASNGLNSDPPSYAAARRISRHIDDSLWKLHVPPAVHRPTPYWGVPRTFRCCQHSHGACCGSRLPFWAAQAWSSSRRVTPRSLWHHFSACLPLLWSPHCPAAGNLPQCSDIPRPHPGYHCIPCKLSGTLDCLRWPQKK